MSCECRPPKDVKAWAIEMAWAHDMPEVSPATYWLELAAPTRWRWERVAEHVFEQWALGRLYHGPSDGDYRDPKIDTW